MGRLVHNGTEAEMHFKFAVFALSTLIFVSLRVLSGIRVVRTFIVQALGFVTIAGLPLLFLPMQNGMQWYGQAERLLSLEFGSLADWFSTIKLVLQIEIAASLLCVYLFQYRNWFQKRMLFALLTGLHFWLWCWMVWFDSTGTLLLELMLYFMTMLLWSHYIKLPEE